MSSAITTPPVGRRADGGDRPRDGQDGSAWHRRSGRSRTGTAGGSARRRGNHVRIELQVDSLGDISRPALRRAHDLRVDLPDQDGRAMDRIGHATAGIAEAQEDHARRGAGRTTGTNAPAGCQRVRPSARAFRRGRARRRSQAGPSPSMIVGRSDVERAGGSEAGRQIHRIRRTRDRI